LVFPPGARNNLLPLPCNQIFAGTPAVLHSTFTAAARAAGGRCAGG
jgi:hypothetical protein